MPETPSLPWSEDFDYAAFRQQVAELATLFQPESLDGSTAFRWRLIARLASLYAAGTRMPPYSPFVPDDDDESPTAGANEGDSGARTEHLRDLARMLSAAFGPDDAYYEVTWPSEGKVERTSLSHELVWIHSALAQGARAWDAGRLDAAAWAWAHGFEEGDWGSRILSVLEWLHCIAGERMDALADGVG